MDHSELFFKAAAGEGVICPCSRESGGSDAVFGRALCRADFTGGIGSGAEDQSFLFVQYLSDDDGGDAYGVFNTAAHWGGKAAVGGNGGECSHHIGAMRFWFAVQF